MDALTEQRIDRRSYTGSMLLSKAYRISWGAVFAGVVMGITAQVVLGALGVGIGASTVDPLQEANPLAGMGTGAAIWVFVSTIVAYYASGWIAARMTGFPARADGVLHGLLTWGFSTILMLLLLTGAVGGALAGTARYFGGMGQVTHSANGGNATVQPPSGTVNNGGIVDQVRNEVTNPQNPQNQQQLRQQGETAAKGTSAAGFASFFLLLFAGIASALGGRSGVRRTAFSF